MENGMYSKSVRKSAIEGYKVKVQQKIGNFQTSDLKPKMLLMMSEVKSHCVLSFARSRRPYLFVLIIPPYGDAGEDEVYWIASHFLMS